MRIGYYPGCSGEGSGIEYKISTLKTAEMLGIELTELEDWNCCGATSGHSTNKLLSLALPARNLAIAEQMGLDTMLTPCAACYSRHRAAELAIRHNEEEHQKIQQAIAMDINGSTTTVSILDLLAHTIGKDKIKEKVKNSLKGMKAACYYGCLLVRPIEDTGFDDAEDPQTMDEIVRALGAETVDWAFKTECCGASLATSRPEIGVKMIYEVLKNAKEAGAECIVTACPLCMLNLDMRQAGAEKAFGEKFNMPIYYVTELVAIAGGYKAEEVGVPKHFVGGMKYLQSIPAKAAAMEAAAPKKAGKAAAADGQDAEALQKKIDAMSKAIEKNPDKMALKIIKDADRAQVLAEVITGDEKKIKKLAELMVTDKEKAVKVADAFVTGELKKRDK